MNIEHRLAEVGTFVEAISILHEARALATRIVNEHWTDLRTLARRLHSRGSMDGAEVAHLMREFRVAA